MFLIILSSLILAKLNSHLLGFQILNPDETQMISNAIGIFNKGIQFLDFDGTTSGILNSLILGWPQIFKLDITFLTTRITSIILVTIILYCLLKIIYFQTKKITYTLFLIGPIWIFFLLTKDPDFSHYSTELFSVTLLITSYLIIIFDRNFNNKTSLVILPTLLGLVLFAKIQFFPVAFLIFNIVIFEFYLQKKKISKYFIFSFFYLLPSIILFFLVFISGNLEDFLINNFLFAYDFISFSQSENILFDVYSENKIITEASIAIEKGFKQHIKLNLIFHIIYVYFLMFLVLFLKLFQKGQGKIIFKKEVVYISIITISFIVVILIPGKMHRHYLVALIPFLPIFISQLLYSSNITFEDNRKLKTFRFTSIILLFLVAISAFLEKEKFYTKKFKNINFNKSKVYFSSPRIFQYLFEDSKQNNLYIWGWMPHWYVLSYMTPSARATISEKQIIENAQKDYYRKRLLNDLEKNKPHLIIDFVKKRSFRYDKPSQNINSFEKLKKFTYQNYVKLKNNDPLCPDYFLSEKNFKIFNSKNVTYNFKDNIELYSKMNDLSVTEDICDDAVYFSSIKNNIIELNLDKPSRISKLMILGGKINSNKVDLKITFHYKNLKSKEKILRLNAYPFWTVLNLEKKGKVKNIQLDVEKLKKK